MHCPLGCSLLASGEEVLVWSTVSVSFLPQLKYSLSPMYPNAPQAVLFTFQGPQQTLRPDELLSVPGQHSHSFPLCPEYLVPTFITCGMI